MATAIDVAACILSKRGATTTIKLQKLVYYCQAWHLVWTEMPLFNERIEAWASGPVVPELFAKHKGEFEVSKIPGGNPDALTAREKRTVDAILKFYGDRPAQWLVDLTHLEAPWKDARKGVPPGHRSSNEITPASMAEYYSSL